MAGHYTNDPGNTNSKGARNRSDARDSLSLKNIGADENPNTAKQGMSSDQWRPSVREFKSWLIFLGPAIVLIVARGFNCYKVYSRNPWRIRDDLIAFAIMALMICAYYGLANLSKRSRALRTGLLLAITLIIMGLIAGIIGFAWTCIDLERQFG